MRDYAEQQLARLKQQREQIRAQLHQHDGAIEMLQLLLAQAEQSKEQARQAHSVEPGTTPAQEV